MDYTQIQNAIGRIMIYLANAVTAKPHDYTHQYSNESIIDYLESTKQDIEDLIERIKTNNSNKDDEY
jgi:hypothetical protein